MRRSATWRSRVAARRLLLLAAVLVAAYFATALFFYESAFVNVVAGWIAVAGSVILAAAGTTAAVSGPCPRRPRLRRIGRGDHAVQPFTLHRNADSPSAGRAG